MKFAALLTLACCALLGCATVSNMDSRAAAIAARGQASLQAAFSDFNYSLSGSKETRSGFGIRSIDGIPEKSVYIGAVHELAPGPHKIEILATRQRGGLTSIPSDSTLVAVEFTAQPGVSYQVSGRITEHQAEAWIAEIQTGRIVSAVAQGTLSTTETPITPVIILPQP